MKTGSSQTHLSSIPDVGDARRGVQNTMSVKEAADRLGLARWKVYRIPRKGGPFLFILAGHRVFIDVASFELHLRNVAGICANDCPAPAEYVQPAQQPVKALDTQPRIHPLPAASPKAPVPSTASLPSRSGGQRENFMRAPSGPCFFSIPSFM